MPPGFRHKRPTRLSKNPTLAFKLLAAVVVICLYFILHLLTASPASKRIVHAHSGEKIQWAGFKDGTGEADKPKARKVVEAMQFTFWQYRKNAWGHDDILPVSGGVEDSRNGWGAFIVDSASTLAVMGLWEELELAVEHIVDTIDFRTSTELVDPFETTIRYLGGLVSLVDLIDSGLVPSTIISKNKRDGILAKAVTLAHKLGPGYDTPTGMPWPRIDFNLNKGVKDPPEIYEKRPELKKYKNPIIGPARTGSNILENRVLSRLTANASYVVNATKAWDPLVWSQYESPVPGMVNAPIDIMTGAPVGRQYHWDAGHDSYYEYLVKASILAPHDRYSSVYADRWLKAVSSLRYHLASRSAPSKKYESQHLFMGKQDGEYFINTQSHLACFAPGNVLLGATYFKKDGLIPLGEALLEGCRHTYHASSTSIGPEMWSWMPKFGRINPTENATHAPLSLRQESELSELGIWINNPTYKLRPEYIESLYYAWRITGRQRYRDWAWEAFLAIEKHCKTKYGYSGLQDVTYAGDATDGEDGSATLQSSGKNSLKPQSLSKKKPTRKHLDEAESFWAAETLKYFWLIFADVDAMSLDRWVFSTEGHPFRMIRT